LANTLFQLRWFGLVDSNLTHVPTPNRETYVFYHLLMVTKKSLFCVPAYIQLQTLSISGFSCPVQTGVTIALDTVYDHLYSGKKTEESIHLK
jgi:hypothetical protein